MLKRLSLILTELEKLSLDGILILSNANIAYLLNYPSRESALLIFPERNYFLTDGRYKEEAQQKLSAVKVVEIKTSFGQVVKELCERHKIKNLGFEEKYLRVDQFLALRRILKRKIRLKPIAGIVETFRQRKDKDEVSLIEKSADIAVKAMQYAAHLIKPGIKENEVAAELERFIRYQGAQVAFPIIVASGSNSAFPHHLTSERKLQRNEPVLVDLGADFKGYKSDLTRVFFLGKINHSMKRIYEIVLAAQKQAFSAVSPYRLAEEPDKAARNYINKMGYGQFFCHSTGHGIGLEVHEEPKISKRQLTKFMPGMVFTIEPAIYLPKKFGIRIEDMILVTEEGGKVISGTLYK
ncbi:MAG: Xaa-Pro peptidase family protein [Candidatus Omnitrophica bacterium]|nr:Xaa-Pro peptidase family protein [Candidatus Omnitrophota bacterium]